MPFNLHPLHSLTHHNNDLVSKTDVIAECNKISQRLLTAFSSDETERLISLVWQLSEFELGRFLIKNQGALSGCWTYYIILGFTESKDLHPLEKMILTTAPTILATRERFHIFQSLLQQHIRSHATVCSIPCGMMADLLTLDIPEDVIVRRQLSLPVTRMLLRC